MKHYFIYLQLTFIVFQPACSPTIHNSQITGEVTTVTDSTIFIGNQDIPITKEGRFNCTIDKEWPVLLGASYAGMYWTVFMKPGSNIEISIPENKADAIEYKGDLKETNMYLLEILPVNQEVNTYFTDNWEALHKLDQVRYVAMIDSLKNIYFEHLTENSDSYEALSDDFIEIWKAEINYGFNELILRYPERHLQYTKDEVELNRESMDYAGALDIDKPEYLDIPNYKIYARARIELESNTLMKQDTSTKNYNIKKIESTYSTIEKLFSNQYSKDLWLTEYLKEYIDNNGITNSKEPLIQFDSICKTDAFRREIENLTREIHNSRNDHEIEVYKTKNDFALEAHIFRPENAGNSGLRPAIAIFHGGGWSSGKASWAFSRAKHFANLGMIGVAVQYRLSNFQDITPVEAMEDVRDLILWLRIHADSLGIDPDKIAGEGWSAGGHLITSAAFFPDATSDGKVNSIPNALILKSPALEADSWCIQLLGNRNIDPKTISPLDNITEGMSLPPVLILQGRADHVTPTKKALLFQERMKAANYQCELIIYEDCGHLFTPSYLDDTGWPRPDKEISDRANKKADDFLVELEFITQENRHRVETD